MHPDKLFPMTESREAYAAWHRKQAGQEGALGAPDATWHRMVRRRLGEVRGLRVAEIGCGRGDFAIYLAGLGARVTALDFSAEAIAIARERAALTGTAVDFLVADAQDTKLPSAAFDLVVSCECIEHVPEPDKMAAELFRICRPGARAIVTTPSYLNGMLIAWAYSLLTRTPINTGAGVQPHENFFLFPFVRRMLARAGFEVVETESRIFQLALLPRVDPAKLRVVEFRHDLLNRVFRPFGLHFLYDMRRPA
jgi:2-polyprenyl-3-methyl-5-hydroxy-6-metoxy-1,4-benzoquinol methylase